jgi:hypothetical protein
MCVWRFVDLFKAHSKGLGFLVCEGAKTRKRIGYA